MNCDINARAFLPMQLTLNRLGRQITKGLFIQQSGIDRIKELIKRKERVVLMPYFRTYTDFFVLIYALFVHKIPIPFTFGNLEDTPRNTVLDNLLKRVGYILTRRDREQSF